MSKSIDDGVTISVGRYRSVADYCRAMGLQVGDTIEGTEGGGSWWHTTRLTLKWLGDDCAVWMVTSRSSSEPEWSEPHEASKWSLGCREWRKLSPEQLEKEPRP